MGYALGPFEINPTRRVLTKAGEPVTVTPKVFDLLLCLVEHHGQVVDKEELLHAVWPDTPILDANLSQTIFVLRKTL